VPDGVPTPQRLSAACIDSVLLCSATLLCSSAILQRWQRADTLYGGADTAAKSEKARWCHLDVLATFNGSGALILLLATCAGIPLTCW